MEFFTAYRDDGSHAWNGSCSDGQFASMIAPEGIRLFSCSQASFEAGGATVGEVRSQLLEAVNPGAVELRAEIEAATSIPALLSIDLEG